jgi:hypothetical protein
VNENLDRVERLIQSVVAIDPSPQFENRIRNRVLQEASRRGQLSRRTAWFVGVAVSAVLAFLFLDLQRQKPVFVAEHSVSAHPARIDAVPASGSAESVLVLSHGVLSGESRPIVVGVSEPLESAAAEVLSSEPLEPRPLEEFSLDVTLQPLSAMASRPVDTMPELQIQPFSLSPANALNQGVVQ